MATTSALSVLDAESDNSTKICTWVITGTNDGAAFPFAQWSDKSVQVGAAGDNFNAGTVIIEGSNDGVTWSNLRGPDSVLLSFTAAGLKQVLETVVYIRPRATVSVTSVTIVLCARRSAIVRN
jgi:hypothetical protein